MTFSTPDEFLDHIVDDEVMQKKFAAMNSEAEIRALLQEVGAAFSPAEVRDAFLERFGDQLTDDQLAAVAGGVSDAAIGAAAGLGAGVFVGTAVAVGAAASAAA